MKKLLITLAILIMIPAMMGATYTAEYEEDRNYMSEIITALTVGDLDTAESLNECRNAKIADLGGGYVTIDAYDLYLLGKIMTAEAGNCPYDECPWGVGEVVMNRVASPEWDMPNTVEGVLTAPYQYYYPHMASTFEKVQPTERCLKLALRLLEGERRMEPDVIFHSNSPIGSGTHSSYKHDGHSRLYFGFSYNRHLYE